MMSERKDLPEDRLGTAYRHVSTGLVAAVRIAGVNRKEQKSVSLLLASDSVFLNVGGTTGDFVNQISRP
ncbi:hypothetical protein SAMN04487897_103143 [Paenibacillus sp. yr247]|uniref:hypothetical protein n=1 Tax=Paenibacillus sp. yr247 TaxID=1761880 RepID=UPI00087DF98D|nr:hypothetical protein [Paenibacillus sp. yr247]SDN55115.1 hypothetical protein SAMN04487897_103143 [Paenibacillus sp. yr247]